MNEMIRSNGGEQVFNFNGANFRSSMIGNVAYICGKDVCDYFGDTDHKRSLGRIDDEEKTNIKIIDSLGRIQTAIGISESGLYSLLFTFQPEKAREIDGGAQTIPQYIQERLDKIKTFRKWVTSEVLPAIRKNGGYIASKSTDTDADIMARAIMIAQATIAQKEAKIKQQNLDLAVKRVVIEGQHDLIEKQEPLMQIVKRMEQSTDLLTLSEVAQIVAKGLKLKDLTKFLIDNKILQKKPKSSGYLPTHLYRGSDYGDYKRTQYHDAKGEIKEGREWRFNVCGAHQIASLYHRKKQNTLF